MSSDEGAWDDEPAGPAETEVVEAVAVTEVVVTAEVVATAEAAEEEAIGDADADAASDAAIDALDDGSALTGGVPVRDDVPGSDVLFTLSSREHFAALDDPEVTGDARVDAASSRLAELPELPTADHVAVYDDVHRRLQDALADAEVT